MSAFLTLAIVHLLGVASPGPDFAIIVKQSLSQPRRVVMWTALGVALGILVHAAYCLLGIGLVISRSIVLFSIIKFLGAAYLIIIGWKALRSKAPEHSPGHVRENIPVMSAVRAFRTGFLTNVLNPKATLFFLAVFTQVIDPATSLPMQLFYAGYMSVATFVWFASLGSVLTQRHVRSLLDVIHVWAERVMGAVLIALGIKVALSSRN